MWMTFLLLFVSLVLGAAARLLSVWAVKNDPCDDVEGQ